MEHYNYNNHHILENSDVFLLFCTYVMFIMYKNDHIFCRSYGILLNLKWCTKCTEQLHC